MIAPDHSKSSWRAPEGEGDSLPERGGSPAVAGEDPRRQASQDPPCLTKGGVTGQWQGTVSIDFWRATLTDKALTSFHAHYMPGTGEQLARAAKGFYRAERFSDGMVRRWDPWSPSSSGEDYESWELPGSMSEATGTRLGSLLRASSGVNVTLVHLAWDVPQQGYPRPWELRDQWQRLGPRSDNKAGRRFEGDDGSQTWYCGTKSADVRLRVYEKGKQQQALGVDAPSDWVRVEFELAGKWAPSLAWSSFLRGELLGYFAQLCDWYFQGPDVGQFFPRGTAGLVLGGESKQPSPAAATLAAMIRQYGAVLDELDRTAPGLLDAIRNLRKHGGKVEDFRRRRLAQALTEVGNTSDLLSQVDFLLNGRVTSRNIR